MIRTLVTWVGLGVVLLFGASASGAESAKPSTRMSPDLAALAALALPILLSHRCSSRRGDRHDDEAIEDTPVLHALPLRSERVYPAKGACQRTDRAEGTRITGRSQHLRG